MRSVFLTLSFLGMLVILSCQKEYFLETKTSEGTLGSDSAGNCLQSVVNGLYVKDSVATSSNFIDARISVVTPGEYSIQTEIINGLSFKGEGTADSIALQTVRLFAVGSPVEAGVYTFHITYGTSVCAVDITVLATGADNSEYSFHDSAGTCLRVTVEGTYKVDVALDDFNYIDLDVDVLKEGAYSFTVSPIEGISFSGSGIFTTRGINTIQLSGTGTPSTAGVVEVSISDGATDCRYSLEVLPGDNATDAVFELDCSSAIAEGIYKKEIALNTDNKVTIQGTVSLAGRYAITTPAVNGVTFNADATFTSSSETPQDIVLTGTGTPVNEGTFDYTVTNNGSTCIFRVTYAAASQQAVFSFPGSPDTCSAPTLAGTFSKGSPLNNSNTASFEVEVTTAGTYVIATDQANGISFSVSGSFEKTGKQRVTLQGAGTPIAGGITTLTPRIASSSCTFDVPVVEAPVVAGVLTCKIDGVFTAFNDRASFTHEAGLAGIMLAMDGYVAPPNGANVTQLGMTIANTNGSAVKAGTYNVDGYLTPNSYIISVFYSPVNLDNSVTRWTTGSSILVTNPPFTIKVSSITGTRVKGTFSGEVTDSFDGGAQRKTITEGVFDLPIQ